MGHDADRRPAWRQVIPSPAAKKLESLASRLVSKKIAQDSAPDVSKLAQEPAESEGSEGIKSDVDDNDQSSLSAGLTHIATSWTQAESITFKSADSDGNNLVSLAEFKHWVKFVFCDSVAAEAGSQWWEDVFLELEQTECRMNELVCSSSRPPSILHCASLVSLCSCFGTHPCWALLAGAPRR